MSDSVPPRAAALLRTTKRLLPLFYLTFCGHMWDLNPSVTLQM